MTQVLNLVHTIGYLMESNLIGFFVVYPMKLTFISLAYTPSVKNPTMAKRSDVKHYDVLKKNEVQCFRACVNLILSMHVFLTDGLPHRRWFPSIDSGEGSAALISGEWIGE